MKQFSKQYKTFTAWKKNKKKSVYVKRIVRLHKLNPKLSLKELYTKKATLELRKWNKLTPAQKTERVNSLSVLSRLRHGISSHKALLEFGTTEEMLKKHVGKFLVRKHKEFIATKTDSIQRGMQVYTKGKIKSIVVKNSKTASVIGQYFNAVRQSLRSGDTTILNPFRRIKIIDSKGKKHVLETRLAKLYEIEESKESPEDFEVYEYEEVNQNAEINQEPTSTTKRRN